MVWQTLVITVVQKLVLQGQVKTMVITKGRFPVQDRTHDACLMSKALHHLGKKHFFRFQNYIMADILIFSWLRRQKLWIAG